MICVCTGQSGLHKKKYLESVQKCAQLKGKDFRLYNIGDLMYQADSSIPPGKILSLPLDKLNLLVERAFRDTLEQIRNAGNPDVIINAHAVFRYKRGLIPGTSFKLLHQINPDCYITLIDDVHEIKANLDSEHPGLYSYGDVLVWREEEILITKIFAELSDKPFFLVPKKHNPEVLCRLLLSPDVRRVYTSFPITNIQGRPEIIAAVERFKRELSRDFVVFDPYTISEKKLEYLANSARKNRKRYFYIGIGKVRGRKKIAVADVDAIIPQIDQQIISRDLQLIDQSHMVIAYVAAHPNGEPVHSAGTQKEVQYASEQGKDVYFICTPTREPGPFERDAATRIFRSVEEARENLAR